ncbi:MAG: hypothetical protein NT077_00585 [Candidatus Taylorbacteria bacterium]|nr:hypothetical protein [Candidatus Taylorbacteria bacterium]
MDGESAPNPFVTVFGALFSLFGEMIAAFFAVLPKIISFILWVLVAIVVLPCVFVAGNIYPKWADWGENF